MRGLSTKEAPCKQGVPRQEYYIYVTEESIESVFDRARAAEITGYFFILVNFRSSLYVDANDDNPQHLRPEDVEDMSFKMIAANEVAMNYLQLAEGSENWHESDVAWDNPPFCTRP